MSKNIFSYAKKELSQDAFLMWLFDSFDSEVQSEKEVSIDFINFLVNFKDGETITKLEVYPQWCKIDITVYITTNFRKIGLFIEDKTTSNEHNQLNRYNDSIKNTISKSGEEREVRRIFYKTNSIDETERARVNGAEWTEISFKTINDFWSKYINSSHLIIRQYAEHVCKIYKDSQNIAIPQENNVIAWKSFFDKVMVSAINDIAECWTYNYRNLYAAIGVRPKGRVNEDMPKLEIRSRDCISGNFIARIDMYNVDFSKNPNGLEIIRDEIYKNEVNGIFKGNYGKKKNKQVAHSPKGNFKYDNIDKFKELTLSSIKEYLKIVSFWK